MAHDRKEGVEQARLFAEERTESILRSAEESRLIDLDKPGVPISSFHAPKGFYDFISTMYLEIMKGEPGKKPSESEIFNTIKGIRAYKDMQGSDDFIFRIPFHTDHGVEIHILTAPADEVYLPN